MNLINTKISWDDIVNQCSTISKKLKDERPFDCIVCIGRGGMIPSRLISENLNIPVIHLIDARYDRSINKVIVSDYNFKQFEGKNLLIVDEVYQTGQSIKKVGDRILDSVDEVCITDCSCYCNINSSYKPDVWGCNYDDKKEWLVFPWEREPKE